MNAPQVTARQKATDASIAALSSDLSQRFGDRVATSAAVREQHGHTLTWVKNQPPDIVAYPRTTEEVSEIVKLCAAHEIPIIPYGTGTSLKDISMLPMGEFPST